MGHDCHTNHENPEFTFSELRDVVGPSSQHEVLQEPLRGPFEMCSTDDHKGPQHRSNENCFRTNLRVVPPLVTCAPMGPSLKLFIIRPSEFSERSCLKVVGIYEECQFKLK